MFGYRKAFVTVLSVGLILPAPLPAYDEVKLEKIIPLVDKKASPSLLKLDPFQNIWISSERNNSIQMISKEGKTLVYLAPGKKPASLFKTPVDFGFLSNGKMVVADAGLERVAVLSSAAEGEKALPKYWKSARLESSFLVAGVASMAVSNDDIIAVGYQNQTYLDIYSSDGVLLHRLFGNEKYPLRKVSGLAFAPNGVLWVIEDGKGALHRFSPDRKWLGAVDGFEGARAVAVDEYGYAYVTMLNGRWREVSPDGGVTGTFGTKGKNVGELLVPCGIAVPDSTRVLVAESGNARLQQFRISNREKKKPLMPAPAAYLQVRLKASSAHVASGGVVLPEGDFLLIDKESNKFETLTPELKTKKSEKKKKSKGTPGVGQAVSIALDKNNQVWVLDAKDSAIKWLTSTGEIGQTLGQKGKKEGSLSDPNMLVIRPDGSFLVVDRDYERVQVLSPSGLFLFTVGGRGGKAGSFDTVTGVAVNDELIAILDGSRKALSFYDASGKFISDVANKDGKVAYWNDPVSVASDKDGRFYVLDRGAKRVRIFNRKGQFLGDFSARGQNLVCGGDHVVLVLDQKSVQRYEVRFVPRLLMDAKVEELDGALRVSWSSNPEATQYAVYRSSGSLGFSLVKTVSESFFNDSGLTPAMTYTYAVSGVNEAGQSGPWSVTEPIKAPRRTDVSLISFESIKLRPVFTAASKYYVTNPIGEIALINNDEKTFRNVKLSLFLKKYTDFATEVMVPEIAPGERKVVPVTMTFNEAVLELTEDTPVQVDVRVAYFEDNKEKSVSQNAPVTLYSRNAISWNDRSRIASFITPRDTPVVEFARDAVREHMRALKSSTVGKPMAKVALLSESVNALSISYVPDPKTPFSEASNNPDVIDYVQFPRETMRRKTGDCDDTTALLSALLVSIGVRVALIDVPGHIFMMADLEESDASQLGFPEERFVKFQGSYWVPVETTQLGRGFMTAWQSGTARVKAAISKNEVHYIPVLEAMETYPPVSLIEPANDRPAYPTDKVKTLFPPVIKQLQEERYEALLRDVKARIKESPADHMLVNQMGMIHAEGGRTEEAQKVFQSLLKEDEPLQVQSAAQNNLGNLAYMNGDYAAAEKAYAAASALVADDGGVLINRARTALKLNNRDAAVSYLKTAATLMPEWRDFTSDLPAELLPK